MYAKALDRFAITGKTIFEDVFHTEVNLTAEECAALCYRWNDNDTV
uniref:Uncharacterized protein n=1 Tax=Tetranychus urticae TaxID=32264 RepID=T1K0A6_TETUR